MMEGNNMSAAARWMAQVVRVARAHRRDAELSEAIQGVALDVDLARLTRLSVKICPEAKLDAVVQKLEELERTGTSAAES